MTDMYLKDIREVAEKRLSRTEPTFQAATVLQLLNRIEALEAAHREIVDHISLGGDVVDIQNIYMISRRASGESE